MKRNIMNLSIDEDHEAEYWDTHSPLDTVAEPESQKVVVRGMKDRPITIRLDSESRLELEKLATKQGLGPSTFARTILMSAIKGNGRLETSESLVKTKEAPVAESYKVLVKEGETVFTDSLLKARERIKDALGKALEHDWKTAARLVNEAKVIVPAEYHSYIDLEIKMVWLCIQRESVGPLITRAEHFIADWEYPSALKMFEEISLILELSQLPLDYKDYSTKIAKLANNACGAASRWKNDYDSKLERTASNIGVLKAQIEDFIVTESEKRLSYLTRGIQKNY
jgi:hypothetical protein